MYLTSQIEQESTAYNLPNVLCIEGKLDNVRLKECIQKLLIRQESMRTGFTFINDRVMQKIYKSNEIKIPVEEISLADTEGTIEKVLAEFVKPFDLSKPPLARCLIGEVSEEKHVLFLDMHHIICDGTSVQILVRELSKLYNGEMLEPITETYKDYAAWQMERKENPRFKKEESYWLQEFKQPPVLLNLPIDYKREEIRSREGAIFYFNVAGELRDKLYTVTHETGTTLFMVLLAGLNITLAKYCHQEEIVIGTAIAGRTNSVFEDIVGVFINTLAIKSEVKREDSFEVYLENLKETVLNAYEYQEYPFDELVNKVGFLQGANRTPFVETMFLLQNMKEEQLILGNAKMKEYPIKKITAKYDLYIEATETKDDIEFRVEYATDILKESSISQFAQDWISILVQIVEKQNNLLQEFTLQSEEELLQMKQEEIQIDFDFE